VRLLRKTKKRDVRHELVGTFPLYWRAFGTSVDLRHWQDCRNVAHDGLDNNFIESILTTTPTILLHDILYIDKDTVHWVNGAHNGSRFTGHIGQNVVVRGRMAICSTAVSLKSEAPQYTAIFVTPAGTLEEPRGDCRGQSQQEIHEIY